MSPDPDPEQDPWKWVPQLSLTFKGYTKNGPILGESAAICVTFGPWPGAREVLENLDLAELAVLAKLATTVASAAEAEMERRG